MSDKQSGKSGPRFWVNTVSLEHVQLGVAGGFTQADHGLATRLRALSPGDGLVFYSPRTAMRGGEPLQEFSALGRVTAAEPYQVERGEMSADFHPWRLAVDFLEVRAAPVRPLVADLEFIPDPKRWGFPFRRGLFEIGRTDFVRIAQAMGIDWERHTTSEAR